MKDIVQENVLPTLRNLSAIYVPGEHVETYVSVTQCLDGVPGADRLQLLTGSLVAAPEAGGWRLRQVLAVEVAAGADPADARVQFVIGEDVAVKDLKRGLLTATAFGELLCAEVGARQAAGELGGLRILDIALVRWKHQLGQDLEEVIYERVKGQRELAAAGASEQAMLDAAQNSLAAVWSVLQEQPPQDFIKTRVLPYVERCASQQYAQLLEQSGVVWNMHCKLEAQLQQALKQ